MAQYADACNIFGDATVIAHKLDVLRRHCDTIGRDPNEIEVTAMYRDLPADPSVDDVVRGAETLAAVGVTTLMTGAVSANPVAWLESTFGPAMERLAAIEATPL